MSGKSSANDRISRETGWTIDERNCPAMRFWRTRAGDNADTGATIGGMYRLFIAGSLALLPVSGNAEKPAAHEIRHIEGWTVQVDRRLLDGEGRATGEKALALLRARLADIVVVVPAERVTRLREVPIWLDLSHGELTSMQYHPSAEWLKNSGYSPAMAKAVHIPVAARFTEARHQHVQPWSVLHELAHAYHDRVIGFDDPRVMAVWEKYVASGRGTFALHVSGRSVPHYGLTNQKEFFAEMTEAYFGRNDFTPFVYGQLKRDEPDTHALLLEIWGPTVLN